MKVSEIQRLTKKYICPYLSGYTCFKDFIFKISLDGSMLLGYYIESREYEKKEFAVWYFIQPLFVKRDHIVLTFGSRLPANVSIFKIFDNQSNGWWSLDQGGAEVTFNDVLNSINRKGEPILNSIKSIEDFYNRFKGIRSNNVRILEAVAYSSVFFQKVQGQNKLLEELINETRNDDGIKWVKQLNSDAKLLYDLKTTSERIGLLNKWKSDTLKDFKLLE